MVLLFLLVFDINRKYENTNPPRVEDFCYSTHNTFMKQDVMKMEKDIPITLRFELGRLTINTFLRIDYD